MDPSLENRALRDAGAVEPLGPDRYGVTISPFYTIPGGYPNGGYLQCLVANGALAAATAQGSPHLHATAVATNYIGGLTTGAAELLTNVRRIGRGVSFVHLSLMQDGRLVTESLVTLGTLHDDADLRYSALLVPAVAPLDACHPTTNPNVSPISAVVECRYDPSSAGWFNGEVSDLGEVKGWLRLNDGDSSWNAWNLLLATDAMVPATFPLGSSGWVPTLQLTSYVRRTPVGEWLRARQWCVVIADGLVDERCELFDDRNELVASSSQLAMVRFPSTH